MIVSMISREYMVTLMSSEKIELHSKLEFALSFN